MKTRQLSVRGVRYYQKFFQRATLIFIIPVLCFSLAESGAAYALAESNKNKQFKTDYKLDTLPSEKLESTEVASEQAAPLRQLTSDNPKAHKSEDTSKRTAFTSIYVNNDGTKTMEYSAHQRNYRDGGS